MAPQNRLIYIKMGPIEIKLELGSADPDGYKIIRIVIWLVLGLCCIIACILFVLKDQPIPLLGTSVVAAAWKWIGRLFKRK